MEKTKGKSSDDDSSEVDREKQGKRKIKKKVIPDGFEIPVLEINEIVSEISSSEYFATGKNVLF